MKKLLTVMLVLSLLCLCSCGLTEEDAASTSDVAPAEETAETAEPEEALPEAEEFDVYAIEMQETPDSSCFSEVGYDAAWQVLAVRFRDSGGLYAYYDFPEAAWQQFIGAASLGSYYSSYIKGQYESERIE